MESHYRSRRCERALDIGFASPVSLEPKHVYKKQDGCHRSLLDSDPVSNPYVRRSKIRLLINVPSTIALTILRNGATNRLDSTADVSLTAAMVVIWQAIELAYSIAAATIATLKRFTESLNTGFGHGELIRVHGQSHDYKMSDRSTSTKDSRASKPSTNTATNCTQGQELQVIVPEEPSLRLQLRPSDIHDEAQVTSPPQPCGSGLSVDTQSEQHAIRQYSRYSVRYDEEPLMSGKKRH